MKSSTIHHMVGSQHINKTSTGGYTVRQSSGFGLLETLVVCFLFISALAVVFSVFFNASGKADVHHAAKNAVFITSGVRSIWDSGNYSSLNVANAIAAEIIPEKMAITAGAIGNVWDGNVTLGGTYGGFYVAYSSVPSDACIRFARSASGPFTSILMSGVSLDVSSLSTPDNYNTFISELSNACNSESFTGVIRFESGEI